MIVVVDVEASGLHPDPGKDGNGLVSVVAYAYRRDDGTVQSRAIPFGQGPNDGALFNDQHDAGHRLWKALLRWLGTHQLVAHNAKYDLTMLMAGAVPGYAGADLVDCLHWDTMLCQHHLDPLHPAGLKPTAERLLGADPWDGDLKDALKKTKPRTRYDLVPWDVIRPYALGDVESTLRLYELQQARLDDGEGSRHVFTREMPVCQALTRMEARGIGFDAEACEQDAQVLYDRMTKLEAALPFKPTPMQAAKFYFDHLDIPYEHERTPTGRHKMTGTVREDLVKRGAPHAADYDEWCNLETAWSTYYNAYPAMTGKDGRLRTVYKQMGTVSGRFSATRVNLQAIPHDDKIPEGVKTVRAHVRPAPGKLLYEVDVSQAEVRVGASLAKCEPMLATLRAGEDVHATVAQLVFDVTPEHAKFKYYRQIAKGLVYLILYGGGAQVFRRTLLEKSGLEVSTSKAYDYIHQFRDAFPEVQAASDAAQSSVERHQHVLLPFGVRSWFQSYEPAYKAFNRQVQGGVAEVMKDVMVAVEDTYPGILLLQIHDSLVLEVDRYADVQAVAEMTRLAFETTYAVPFEVDVKPWT
jgi:DNA polymerase I-like protein with 3'-5' exonuclease and polymerase domains